LILLLSSIDHLNTFEHHNYNASGGENPSAGQVLARLLDPAGLTLPTAFTGLAIV